MPVNMNPSARFRAVNYSALVVGRPLTDAAIRRYEKQGRYGKPQFVTNETGKRSTKKARTTTIRHSPSDIVKMLLH